MLSSHWPKPWAANLSPRASRSRLARCPLDDPAVRLAGVGERLALAELEEEQPLLGTRLGEARRPSLAVVEDVGRLVDDEVLDAPSIHEVLGET